MFKLIATKCFALTTYALSAQALVLIDIVFPYTVKHIKICDKVTDALKPTEENTISSLICEID